jgi:hypothetical protein
LLEAGQVDLARDGDQDLRAHQVACGVRTNGA